ncbi:MAG: ATP-binding cassette domain-containing protein, partial [Actinomyces sp.]
MTATATASLPSSPTHGAGHTPGLRLTGVSKSFGRQKVLADLDLSAYSGRVYGLLGLNGAGKSTAFNIALGLLTPDAGRVEIQGAPFSRR